MPNAVGVERETRALASHGCCRPTTVRPKFGQDCKLDEVIGKTMRLLVSVTLGLFLLLLGCGGGKPSPQPPVPNGVGAFTIAVQSSPPGAEILLDGRVTGFRSTALGAQPIPINLPLVEGQPQLLTLRMDGYHEWNQWVERTSEGAIIVRAPLRPNAEPNGELLVTSEPSGARIFLNGKDTGKTTPATLSVPPSAHALKVELSGYLPAYETVFVTAGERWEVHLPLQPPNMGVISGVLFDRFGATPSGARVQVRNRQGQLVAETHTSAFGLFRFPPLPPGTYTVTASMTVEGAEEVGQVEDVAVLAGQRTFVPLVVFPAEFLGTVEGVVKTPAGQPVADAQVALLYYAADLDFVLTSRRTFTDSQGRFALEKVPAAKQVLVARKQGYQAVQTEAIVRVGERTFVEVALPPLGTLPTLQPPTQVFAIAYTVPTQFSVEGDGGRGTRDGMHFYRRVLWQLLKRRGHPAAPLLAPNAAVRPPLPRFFPEGFIGSVGVGWQPSLPIPSQGLLGYRVYRSIPTQSGWQLRLVIDEPEQTTAEDVAFDFTPGQTYRYAVSAVALDGKETKRSEPVEATFLPPVRLLEPADNAEVAQSQLRFRWTPVGGTAPFYFVQLYSDLEAILLGNPVWSTDAIAGTTQAVYDGQPLLKGKTYWWLVIGTDQRDWHDAEAFTVSPLRRVVIVGD